MAQETDREKALGRRAEADVTGIRVVAMVMAGAMARVVEGAKAEEEKSRTFL